MSHSIPMLVLRRVRAPLIVLISVYAIAVLGMAIIPGADAAGNPTPPMSFFHAFYFVSYTATTIGFGELPIAFSNAQRLWTTFVIYLSVVGWSYTILTLLALLQDHSFQNALRAIRFARHVRLLNEPFYLICGCGDTGRQLTAALDRLDVPVVVVDINPQRVQELDLHDFRRDAIALSGDARSPETMQRAGITHRHCRGVLAVTDDDHANLAVAMTAHLLQPSLPVIARTTSAPIAANLKSIGTSQVVDPFTTFADYLLLAMKAPGCYRLLDWLTGMPGTTLRAEHMPPRGDWIVVGYGRFGSAVAARLRAQGLNVRSVDPGASALGREDPITVEGGGTEAHILKEAGIAEAEGLVAGTDDDVANLAIAVTGRELRPQVFVVIRQNQVRNRVLFDAFNADVVMQPSEIIAHECLAQLTTPLLRRFLCYVKEQTDNWADNVIIRLRERAGDEVPLTWSVEINPAEARAVCVQCAGDDPVRLDELLRDPRNRSEPLGCEALMLLQDGKEIMLPAHETELSPGDEILFAGTSGARTLQRMTLANENALLYVHGGRSVPSGWIWDKLAR